MAPSHCPPIPGMSLRCRGKTVPPWTQKSPQQNFQPISASFPAYIQTSRGNGYFSRAFSSASSPLHLHVDQPNIKDFFFFGLTRPLLDAAIGRKAGSFSMARQSRVFVVDHPEPRLGAGAGNRFSLKALSGEQKAQEENPNLPFTPKFLCLCYSAA